MNLTSVVIGYTIESVALVAIGGAMNAAGVREFPAWVSEDALIIVAGLYVAAHAIGMVAAVISKPRKQKLLPNRAQTTSQNEDPQRTTQQAQRRTNSARQRTASRRAKGKPKSEEGS